MIDVQHIKRLCNGTAPLGYACHEGMVNDDECVSAIKFGDMTLRADEIDYNKEPDDIFTIDDPIIIIKSDMIGKSWFPANLIVLQHICI
mgnify:CR=1 FL=1